MYYHTFEAGSTLPSAVNESSPSPEADCEQMHLCNSQAEYAQQVRSHAMTCAATYPAAEGAE